MTDLAKPPYADADGNPTPANPNYTAWKAEQDMAKQTDINGAPKAVPQNRTVAFQQIAKFT